MYTTFLVISSRSPVHAGAVDGSDIDTGKLIKQIFFFFVIPSVVEGSATNEADSRFKQIPPLADSVGMTKKSLSIRSQRNNFFIFCIIPYTAYRSGDKTISYAPGNTVAEVEGEKPVLNRVIPNHFPSPASSSPILTPPKS